jgi:hypothetical protein
MHRAWNACASAPSSASFPLYARRMAQPIIPMRAPATGGDASEPPRVPPTPRWIDALMLCVVAAVAYGIMRAAAEWRAPLSPNVRVSLSARQLPYYAGLSTLRMAIAYVLSLAFSIAYARIAAGSRAAERLMLPLLDILQSVPILSFMPGVVLGFAALFPGRTLGAARASGRAHAHRSALRGRGARRGEGDLSLAGTRSHRAAAPHRPRPGDHSHAHARRGARDR